MYFVSSIKQVSGEGNGNPLQYSCLDNPMDREAWRATVCGVAKSRTQMSHKHISSRLPKAPLILPPKTWEILLTKVFFCKEPEEHSVKSISRLVEFKSVTRAARLHFHHVRPLAVWSMFPVYQRTPFPRCGERLQAPSLPVRWAWDPKSFGFAKNGIHRPKQNNHIGILTHWVKVDNMGYCK